MNTDEIIAELRRVADLLQTSTVTQREFAKHGRIGVKYVESKFGSWTDAIVAAGLDVTRQRSVSEDELLEEIIRLTKEIGRKPTERLLDARGRFSLKQYRSRWGNLMTACEVAYSKYGFPLDEETNSSQQKMIRPTSTLTSNRTFIPRGHKPLQSQGRKKVLFGEPIDFRGLRHAPIDEQGVVYIFGMVSRELGFLIEAVRTAYPDCKGKQRIQVKPERWVDVSIEFEFKSSNFRVHGHNPEGCDLIVCWIHDWQDCPIEVLELSSQIKYLLDK